MTEPHDDEIIHREIDTDREEPAAAIAEAVSDLEGTPVNELPAVYNCIDGMLLNLYSDPPAPEAQMSVEFTYNGYRITVEQSGTVKFVRVS
ncbi:HalOD1 output domain-containing protein [Halorubrum sp. CSM-61]|uniref:HalOD1 output domain-containing protein n=1 Tax=Halorubrum sp. CSM-61 TaxID=2485838 RepID=UPI000F4BA683|nr:HalOD1 output domain-containing protein [Halorubrum sp. CSM-61]